MKKEVRVLHVVYAMNVGGIESWIMHLFKKSKESNIHFDFMVFSDEQGFFDAEIKKLGGKIIFIGHFKKNFNLIYKVFLNLKSNKKYDAIHIHNLEGACAVIVGALISGNRNIIVQAHTDLSLKLKRLQGIEKYYLKISRAILNIFPITRVAVSKSAGRSFYGKRKFFKVSLGEDFSIYKNISYNIKKEIGYDQLDELVVVHVGRFHEAKNHIFLLDVFYEINKIYGGESKLLLVGNGPLLKNCKDIVARKKIEKNVYFLGERNDVASILKNEANLFIFPSLYEGLGLAVVEAQAAGLPIICSSSIPDEAVVVNELVLILDLNQSADIWAKHALEHFDELKNYSCETALKKILNSPFNIDKSVQEYQRLWLQK